jgi:amidase
MSDLRGKGQVGQNALTASEAAARLDDGTLTAERLVEDCLARIAAREPEIQAWDHIDPQHALDQARACDRTPRKSALHGIPVGIKDIFDTLDMPTGHGFGPYQGRRWGIDSACVAQLRAAGMVIMGKTVTTEFACPVRRRTVNPHDPSRSPGVSSSGSAAAVADFMVPLATGSQTGGSVIGPSANCGVYGYKASLDGIDRGAFRHCKRSIDTIGHFARSIEDLLLFRQVQTCERAVALPERGARLRVGVVKTSNWDIVEPAMKTAIDKVAGILVGAGAEVTEVVLPQRFDEIVPDFSVSNGWEAAEVLAAEIKDHFDAFNPHNRARIEFVRTLSVEDYQRASRELAAARGEMDALHSKYDVFISPSEPGEAPDGLDKVHSANFARLWTQMHMPAVNLPLFTGDHGLPIGFQVIGRQNQDDRTLALAAWIDGRLREALGAVPVSAAQ